MKRFAFPLENVLKLKQRRERLAQIRLLQARLAFNAAEAEVNEANDRIAQLSANLQRQRSTGIDARSWIAQYQQSYQLGKQLEIAEAKRAQTVQEVEEADRARAEIGVEVEALLTLRHRQRQTHRQEVEHERQELADELVLRRWRAARGEGALSSLREETSP